MCLDTINSVEAMMRMVMVMLIICCVLCGSKSHNYAIAEYPRLIQNILAAAAAAHLSYIQHKQTHEHIIVISSSIITKNRIVTSQHQICAEPSHY